MHTHLRNSNLCSKIDGAFELEAHVILDAYVGSKLRQLRLSRMVDPERVSRQLGIKREVLSDYERGHKTIPARMLFGLATHFDVRLSYFFDGYEPATSHSLLPFPKASRR